MARSTARTQAGAANRTPSRTFADQLRGWPDDRLSRLLRDRPDLATPAPQDSGQLASRAAARSSVPRALDLLTRAELCVLDALVAAGQTTQADLVAVVNAAPASVAAAVDRLVDLALAWESPGGLRAVGGVADLRLAAPPRAPGLGGLRPFSPERAGAARRSTARLAELSPPARALLEHVDESGGEATAGSARHTVLPEDAATPAEELLARRLLVPRSGGQVWVPGEVSVALRGGHTTRERVDVVPTLATTERADAVVERTAAGAAFEVVRRLELLLDHWGTHPPAELRGGGSGRARAARRRPPTCTSTSRRPPCWSRSRPRPGCSPRASTTTATPSSRRPTSSTPGPVAPTAERWSVLATAWLGTPRLPGLVGTARRRRQGPLRAVAREHQRLRSRDPQDDPRAGSRRCRPARCWRPAPVPPRSSSGWRGCGPRRPRTRADQVAWALAEATALGLLALGGLPAYAPGAAGRRGRRRSCWRRCCPSPSTTCCCRPT